MFPYEVARIRPGACPSRGMPSPPANPTRRAFLALALTAFHLRPASAQPARTSHRIGWVSTETQPDPFIEGFREGLKKYGYTEGQDVILEVRYAPGNPQSLQGVVSELMNLKVNFIVSSGPAIQVMKTADAVPVLFCISGDPIELGIANSLARPGRNFTGSTFLSLEIAGKRVELLKQALPRMRTLAVLSNTSHPGEKSERRATEAAAQSLGVALTYFPFATVGALDSALGGIRDARPDAIIVFPDGSTLVNRAKIAQFAIAQRLPSMFGWSEYCHAGGLMSYGANQRETYVRLAAYADKLIRGASPAELPIEQPATFELVLNLKTAKAIGVTIPQSLLVRADEVIR